MLRCRNIINVILKAEVASINSSLCRKITWIPFQFVLSLLIVMFGYAHYATNDIAHEQS